MSKSTKWWVLLCPCISRGHRAAERRGGYQEKVRKTSTYMHADSHACPCMHMHTDHWFYVRLARATERSIWKKKKMP